MARIVMVIIQKRNYVCIKDKGWSFSFLGNHPIYLPLKERLETRKANITQ